MTVENITKVIYDAIDDKLGKDIAILNIGAVSSLCDYFVIATASSPRQVKAIADNVEDELTKLGIEARGKEGYETKFGFYLIMAMLWFIYLMKKTEISIT